ncbi:hypothetical protein GCM10020258_09510 [Sphingomonas yabuuchiae]
MSPAPIRRRRKIARHDVFVIALAYLLAMLIFFRVPIASGFDLGFGERGDALIEMTILEHWRNVWSGVSSWNSGFYFHPYGGTLGYNDGYFLYGIVYSLWRLVADPFHADTLNILTFKTIGFFAAYALVGRTLRWGRGRRSWSRCSGRSPATSICRQSMPSCRVSRCYPLR